MQINYEYILKMSCDWCVWGRWVFVVIVKLFLETPTSYMGFSLSSIFSFSYLLTHTIKCRGWWHKHWIPCHHPCGILSFRQQSSALSTTGWKNLYLWLLFNLSPFQISDGYTTIQTHKIYIDIHSKYANI